ncbi:phage tail spike protein, partial [Peptoniphilaceae bacterium SGI.097]
MRLIVINRHGLRQKNLIGKVTHKMAVNALDTLSIETTEGNVDKGDRLLYCDRFGAWHEFIVASVETSHGAEGVNYTIYAENSVVELRGSFLEDLRNTNASADLALQKAINKTGWRGVAENLGIANTNYYRESALSAVQKILEAYGAEMETEIRVAGSKVIDRVLHIKKRVGNDLGKRFSFTKDVTGLRRTVEEDDIITRLYGFGASVNMGEGNSRRISFAEINGGLAYVDNLEAQKKYGQNGEPFAGSVTFDKIEDKTLLLAETKKALEDLAKPRVTYEVSVVDLSQAGIAADGVGIGDVVRIRDAVLDLSLQARVLEMEEDLDNIEDTRITLGSYSRFFGEQLAGMESALARLTSKESVYDRAGYIAADGKNIAYIDTIVKNLNDQFNAGTSNMRFDPSEGITITDKATDEESTWALNLSSLGFRVANGKLANGEWNWRTFGTGEGFTADLIRAGRLEGGEVHWNLENGVLQIGDESTGSLLYDPEMGLILTPKKMTLPDELKTELKGEKGDPGSQGMPGKEGPPGKDGADGQPGEEGIGVREVLYEYATSTSAETPPTSGWVRELPNVDSKIYVWTR